MKIIGRQDLGVVRDVTDRRLAEREKNILNTASTGSKMEAIGTCRWRGTRSEQYSSGIVSYPDLMLSYIAQNNPLRGSLLTIQSSGEKAATIVSIY